jgi:transcriptional regulator with XRE-family HTH domain
MPKINQRTIQAETDLARRIAWERERQGLSYERLAQAMTEAGCTITRASLFQIEKGEPPRRVTVNELVALATVFNVPVQDLLLPPELARRQGAHELIAKLDEAEKRMRQGMHEAYQSLVEFFKLLADDRELGEFVWNQWQSRQGDDTESAHGGQYRMLFVQLWMRAQQEAGVVGVWAPNRANGGLIELGPEHITADGEL